MRIGVPKETAEGERRVALVPEVVQKLTGAGHEVIVEATRPSKRREPSSRPRETVASGPPTSS